MSNWYSEPVSSEVSYEDILAKANNSEFHEWNFEPFETQENGYEDVISELRKYRAVDYIALDEKYKKAEEAGNTVEALGYKQQMDKMVNDVLAIYRSKNIFPIQYYSELGVMDEIEKCIAYKAKFNGNTVSCVSGDTEYFNGKEWKRIDEYTEGDKVLQFTCKTGELVEPLKYIHYQSDDPFYSSSELNNTAKLTGNHNVVHYNDSSAFLENRISKTEFSKLLENDLSVDIPTSCVVMGSIHESIDVLSQTASAVILQNESLMTEYNILQDGYVILSDKCYSLDIKERRILCKLFGISEDLTYIEEIMYGDVAIPPLCCLDRVVITSVNSIVSFTFSNINLLIIEENGINKVILGFGYERQYYGKDGYTKTYEKDKYCFSVPSGMLILRRNGKVFITGNCGAGIGTGLCRWLFPNLFDTPSAHDLNKKDAESQYKKFLNDEYLKRAIKFCYSYKDGCPVPTSVEGGLRLVGSAPSNFRPMNAKAVYERFCPKGGTIFDFCCGFGGRMLGALTSKNKYRYVGTDPCTETMYHLHQLAEYIEMVTGREDSYELHCCGAEEFRGKPNSIDFAFSSPPYFNLEVYSDEETQCYNKFPELNEWLEGFVRATIKNIYYMLKPGCFYAVNIADFKVGGGSEVAYVDEWKRISAEEGMPLFDTVYLGVTARAGSAEQAAGELKKENILIFKKPL